jgi:uncharacterized membrane protein
MHHDSHAVPFTFLLRGTPFFRQVGGQQVDSKVEAERIVMTNETHHAQDAANSSGDRLRYNKNITKAVYVLQAASFLVGITLIAAVMVNYIKRDDVRGTWLASHFRWQIRTFWFVLVWATVGVITFAVGVGVILLAADVIWLLYRIIKGWLSLAEGKEMYAQRT